MTERDKDDIIKMIQQINSTGAIEDNARFQEICNSVRPGDYEAIVYIQEVRRALRSFWDFDE